MNRLNNYISLISSYRGGAKTELCEFFEKMRDASDWPAMKQIQNNPPTPSLAAIIADYKTNDKEYQNGIGKYDIMKALMIARLADPKYCPTVGPPVLPPVLPPGPVVPQPQGQGKTTVEIPYYDSGDQQYHTFKVTVYATKQNRDLYVGGGSVNRSETVKSVLDSFKQKCNTCIVSSGKQYVKSLEGKDLYTTFAHLNLKYDNAEIYIIS